ncbi:hypothetical protein [Methylobacterium pseudosasicola]|uniref:hypothetical protein n=1 Tax=Methylobacterium pseudosasicola TaxID=582667 RepID=UPI001ABF88DB|nr:hypothetical protein [Methylobacterium pseudosasicola]
MTVLLLTVGGARARGGGGHGLSGTGSSGASHAVSGYTTSRGTVVGPYHATNPNGTARDNFGTRGNVNPYTGAVGTHGADR